MVTPFLLDGNITSYYVIVLTLSLSSFPYQVFWARLGFCVSSLQHVPTSVGHVWSRGVNLQLPLSGSPTTTVPPYLSFLSHQHLCFVLVLVTRTPGRVKFIYIFCNISYFCIHVVSVVCL